MSLDHDGHCFLSLLLICNRKKYIIFATNQIDLLSVLFMFVYLVMIFPANIHDIGLSNLSCFNLMLG